MDSRNLFETPATYRIMRLEYTAALIFLIVLAVLHLHQINIWAFVGLFFYIDLIGYVPGAIAAHRSETGYIPRGYYFLYNTMHTFLSVGVVAGLWCLLIGPEWALLALPIHLFTDRGIVGNTLKPLGVRFEPQEHPSYYVVRPLLNKPRPPHWREPVRPSASAVAAGGDPFRVLTDTHKAG